VYVYLLMRPENVALKPFSFLRLLNGVWLLGLLMCWLSGPIMYTFTVSTDGILRFHLPNDLPLWKQAFYAYVDTEMQCCLGRRCNFFKNIMHRVKYGCFCFGVFYQDPAHPQTNVLMRFNRWGDNGKDINAYWAAVQAGSS